MKANKPVDRRHESVLEEVRRIRTELSVRFDNDVRKLAEYARTYEAQHPGGIVKPKTGGNTPHAD